MIGLSYYLIFYLYYLVSRYFWRITVEWAGKTNRSRMLWGGFVIFIFYNIIFWDLIPVYALHAYKCATEGGLVIYKSVDDWKRENPGVAETLNSIPDATQRQFFVKDYGLEKIYQLPDGTRLTAHYDVLRDYMFTRIKRDDGVDASWLNQRFMSEHENNNIWYIVRKKEDRIIDILTGEVLVRSIDFDTSLMNPFSSGKDIKDLKIWMKINSCEKGQHYHEHMAFNGYEKKIKLLGETK